MYVSSPTPTPENPRVSSFVEHQHQHQHHTHHLRRQSDLQSHPGQHAYDQAFYAVQMQNQGAHSGDQQQLYNFEMMDHSRRQQYSDAGGSSIASGHAMVHHDSSTSNSSSYVSSPSSQSVSNTTPSTTTSGSVTTTPGKSGPSRKQKLELVDKQQICLLLRRIQRRGKKISGGCSMWIEARFQKSSRRRMTF